jgi:RNA polymerase sigma-70 factor (ECF subfamily)
MRADFAPSRKAAMAGKADNGDPEAARRFRELALPQLDAVYTLARFILRDAADAEDAVQECYVRALAHFGTFRGSEIKPWLFAILRNVCHAQRGQRQRLGGTDGLAEQDETAAPLWQEPPDDPETAVLQRHDRDTVRGLVAALPEPFRETLVLRDVEDLSYRQIADAVSAPIGTVMSRLARARALLRAAWIAAQDKGSLP